MTFLHVAEWSAGILAFWLVFCVVFAILAGSVWESEDERQRELSEMRRVFRRGAEGGEG